MLPGSRVLRTTTTCERSMEARAAPISLHEFLMYVRSRLPLRLPGVPTHTRERSELAIASAALVVARKRFAATPADISSSRCGSTIGLRPLLIISTLVGFTSTPITSWPSRAKQAAETEPTYPSPKILSFIYSPLSKQNESLLDSFVILENQCSLPIDSTAQNHHRPWSRRTFAVD